MTPAASSPRVLYRGGSVYSPADPFATALLVDGGAVAWVGSDEAADAQVARAARAGGGVDVVVELDGALVTPAFVDAHAQPAGPASLAAAAALGVGSVHAWSPAGAGAAGDLQELVAASRAPQGEDGGTPEVLALAGATVATEQEARAVAASLALPGGALLGLWADAGIEDGGRGGGAGVAALSDHVVACTRAGLQAGVRAAGPRALATALAAFTAAADLLGVPAVAGARHRLDLVDDEVTPVVSAGVDDGAVAAVARLGLVLGVRATAGGAVSLAALAAAGVPLALSSGAARGTGRVVGPWEAVRSAAFPPVREHAVSARAAFLAATRGGWRAARRDAEGVLVPGAPATFAVWERAELVVQAPDDRFQAWSTDVRSGTPGLPDLTPGTPAPRCLLTAVRGRTAFDAGALGAAA